MKHTRVPAAWFLAAWATTLADALVAPRLAHESAGSLALIPPFEDFVQTYGRSYERSSSAGASEYAKRSAMYGQRVQAARRQNDLPRRRWTAGVNEHWDWTEGELAKLRGWRHNSAWPPGSSHIARRARRSSFLQAGRAEARLPEATNWEHLRATQDIRDQGGCGSCWAFASATMLQAQAEIHTQTERTFSVQELVDCVPNPRHCGGTGGCSGATAGLAMAWVMQNGSVEEARQPYLGYEGTCRGGAGMPDDANPLFASAASFRMTGWEVLPENKYWPLMRAVAELGPVAVTVAADGMSLYSSGIYDGCPLDAIVNHAVVLVGYGVDANSGDKFWTIQNSWGRGWGEHGLMRILRHDDDEDRCGVNHHPEQGSGCIGGPPQVPVCGMCGILFEAVVARFEMAQA